MTTIFFESLVDPKIAKTVASEIGARTAVLDPVEGVKAGDDYLSVQRRNAAALHPRPTLERPSFDEVLSRYSSE